MFEKISRKVTDFSGSPWAFILALLSIVVWAICGPFLGFSDTWQLLANTGTTLITFLMVFLIQHSQDRDTKALHEKIDELIRVNSNARDELIGIEKEDK